MARTAASKSDAKTCKRLYHRDSKGNLYEWWHLLDTVGGFYIQCSGCYGWSWVDARTGLEFPSKEEVLRGE